MKKISYPVFFLLALISLQGCSKYTELEVKGPSKEKLDIILVPSHYYGQDAGSNKQWVKDAEAIRKQLLEHHFWKNYRNKINMYRLDVSIADDFMQSGENWVPNQAKIKAFALENFPSLDFNQNDQIIFAVESVAYNNEPWHIPVTRGDPNIVQLETGPHLDTVVHEFGHSFGLLADEYEFELTISDWESKDPNTASGKEGNRCDDKWGDLKDVVIDAPGTFMEKEGWRTSRTVGCYLATKEKSQAKGFRPVNGGCIMNQVTDTFPFCPVCQRQLIKQLSKYTPFDKKSYHQVKTFQSPSEFKDATINLAVINFDQLTYLYPKPVPPDWPELSLDIDAPLPGVLAGRLYAQSGVSFTSGVIFKEEHFNASSPNVLGATTLNPMERALIAGYFSFKRICAIGIYNTGSTSVTLRTYNVAFLETGEATVASNADTKPFIGIRATGPIHRFEIDAPSATGFSVDDLSFGECPE